MMQPNKVQVDIAAFEEFLAKHRDGLYELIDGEIIEKMVTERHGFIAVNISSAIRVYLKSHKIGRVLVETRYRPKDDKRNSRLPDVSFRRTDAPVQEKGAIEGMPDLAVEIKSPDDSNKDMRAAADFYIANGCKMIWLIFPEKKLVEVHRPDADFEVFLNDETLSGEDVLPDFTLPVAEIFED